MRSVSCSVLCALSPKPTVLDMLSPRQSHWLLAVTACCYDRYVDIPFYYLSFFAVFFAMSDEAEKLKFSNVKLHKEMV